MLRNYNNIFIAITLIFSSLTSQAKKLDCYPAENIRYIYLGKQKNLKQGFCVDQKNDFLINSKCYPKLNCKAAKSHNLPEKLLKLYSPIGSPSHRNCHAIKGSPMFVDYRQKNEWVESAICIFDDESFIGLDYLNMHLIKSI